jgi:hypothetical protein
MNILGRAPFQVGDLVSKDRGNLAGSSGVVTRIYNENSAGSLILEVLCDGVILQWAASWCERIQFDLGD